VTRAAVVLCFARVCVTPGLFGTAFEFAERK
jgi:hypothetical protein